MSITINSLNFQIDETERRFGNSTLKVDLSIRDTTPFFDRTTDPIDRYAFKIDVRMFSREGTRGAPTRENPETFKFEKIALSSRLECDRRRFPPSCRMIPFTRTTEIYKFDPDLTNILNDNDVRLRQRANMVVNTDILDVDKAITIFVGQEITIPKPDSIFVRVSIVDLTLDNNIILTSDSNVVSDYFGSNERISRGDNREVPVAPVRALTL